MKKKCHLKEIVNWNPIRWIADNVSQRLKSLTKKQITHQSKSNTSETTAGDE